jgi:hypothetical protein
MALANTKIFEWESDVSHVPWFVLEPMVIQSEQLEEPAERQRCCSLVIGVPYDARRTTKDEACVSP